jgi:hypothetical protein
MLCFLLKICVGQSNSANALKKINSKKLKMSSMVIASADDKNEKLVVINQFDVSK